MKHIREVVAFGTIAAMILAGCSKKEDVPNQPTAKDDPVAQITTLRKNNFSNTVERVEDKDAICYLTGSEGISCIPKNQGLTLQLQDDEEEDETPPAKTPTKQM